MLISGEKILMSAELRGCITWFIYFLDLVYVRYNCAKFHHCEICVTDFREGCPFWLPPHPWAVPKMPILNRVNITPITVLVIFESRYAAVWNAHFHHQDHLDFIKHLINVYLLKKVNGWQLISYEFKCLMEARGCNNLLCYYTENDVSTKVRGRR